MALGSAFDPILPRVLVSCEALLQHWPSREDTRATLERVVMSAWSYYSSCIIPVPQSGWGPMDSDGCERLLRLMIERWPDERSRRLLSKVVKSPNWKLARQAVVPLWEHWPDEESREILAGVGGWHRKGFYEAHERFMNKGGSFPLRSDYILQHMVAELLSDRGLSCPRFSPPPYSP